jgi:cellulose synthase/poly-beta-1,6-N-acetylglucosamine synthase-like glycosyltransferase
MEALDSVRQQIFTDYELIVVDDGSTDGTEIAILEMLNSGKSEHKFKYLRQENAGPGAARNVGAALAQGDYLAFLDSDDLWMPWTLEVYRQAIDFGNGAAFVSGRGVPIAQETAFSGKAEFHRFGFMLEACRGTILPVGGTPSVAVKKISFERVGGLPPGRINGEDMDLWFRLGMEPGFVKIENPTVFQQRYHSANISLDMRAAVGGVQFLFSQEAAGRFPGGTMFEKPRKRILAASARATSLDCLRAGQCVNALKLFSLTFSEQLRQGRWKYLLAFFPILLVKSMLILNRKV